MGFMHSSRTRGRMPASLRLAADVRFKGHSADGDSVTSLHFEVAPFGEVASDLFRQNHLWEDCPRPEQTAFELLGVALGDVAARRTESSHFDTGLLRRFARYRSMFARRQLNRIVLPDSNLVESAQLDASVVAAALELSAATPEPKRVRIAGRLDVMGASQGVLKLDVRPGVVVTAIWEGNAALETLKEFFNRDVVIEGMAVFRPSGSLLRVDASAIAQASTGDDFFRDVPIGIFVGDDPRAAQLRPGERSVYVRILGSIPAEESDEEFASAIDAMS